MLLWCDVSYVHTSPTKALWCVETTRALTEHSLGHSGWLPFASERHDGRRLFLKIEGFRLGGRVDRLWPAGSSSSISSFLYYGTDALTNGTHALTNARSRVLAKSESLFFLFFVFFLQDTKQNGVSQTSKNYMNSQDCCNTRKHTHSRYLTRSRATSRAPAPGYDGGASKPRGGNITTSTISFCKRGDIPPRPTLQTSR